jgi:hypothetical protein
MNPFGAHGKKYKRVTRTMKRDEMKKVSVKYIQTSILIFFNKSEDKVFNNNTKKQLYIIPKKKIVKLKRKVNNGKFDDCYNSDRQLTSFAKNTINKHCAEIFNDAFNRTGLGSFYLDAEKLQTTKALSQYVPHNKKCLYLINKNKDVIDNAYKSRFNKNHQLNICYGLFDDMTERFYRDKISFGSCWFDSMITWGVKSEEIKTSIDNIFKYKLLVNDSYFCITNLFRAYRCKVKVKGAILSMLDEILISINEIARKNDYRVDLIKTIIYNKEKILYNSFEKTINYNNTKFPNAAANVYMAFKCYTY